MTREETIELLAVIKVAYPQQLGKMSDVEVNAMVGLWADEFRTVPKQVMEIAAKDCIHKNDFFPSIKNLRDALSEMYKIADAKILIGYEVPDDDPESFGNVKTVHYDAEATRKLEFIRNATAEFANRKNYSNGWLTKSIQTAIECKGNNHLSIGGGN